MATVTPNFNWPVPTSTDLVKDGATAIEALGDSIDASLVDLKGGTSGQILAKNSNTDMDFAWIANDQGDITGVTATSPLTGGGTSGAITVGIQASSTTQSGAVQLSDSTSTTSSVLAATPTAVKSAYDLAAAAVPKSTVTTAGDVIYATGSGAVTRLGIGTAGQVLTVNPGATAPSWAAATGGGKVLQVVFGSTSTSASSSVTSFADTNLTATITPTSATSKVLVLVSQNGCAKNAGAATSANVIKLLRGATELALVAQALNYSGVSETDISAASICYLDTPATTSATTYKTTFANFVAAASVVVQSGNALSTIVLLEIGA